ncbi:hypothetical protein ABVG11_16295 [Streptomyces sp. HD1123-B1]|uniref:hypothetical protein n=1 Tax=Streptomyces huangiella TaxID=3228804 RepID=UPI003D7E6A0A
MTSLALPAALATAGLLSGAEAAYAAIAPDAQTRTATYGYPGQPMGDDVTLTSGTSHPCEPIGNVTITDYGPCCPPVNNVTIADYGHCCPPVNNMTITDYGHCCPPVNNMTITDYGWVCEVDDDFGRESRIGHFREYTDDAYDPRREQSARG